MALTLHVDASDLQRLYATYSSSGIHTGDPADGGGVQVWDDELDGLSDVALIYPYWEDTTFAPTRTAIGSSPMLNSCIRFDGNKHQLWSLSQTGLVDVLSSSIITQSSFSFIAAIYPQSVVLTDGFPYNNHVIWTDGSSQVGLSLMEFAGTHYADLFRFNGSAYQKATCVIVPGVTNILCCSCIPGFLYIYNTYNTLDGSVATTGTASLSSDMRIGGITTGGGTGIGQFNGYIGELKFWDAGLEGAAFTTAINYFVERWVTGPVAQEEIWRPIQRKTSIRPRPFAPGNAR